MGSSPLVVLNPHDMVCMVGSLQHGNGTFFCRVPDDMTYLQGKSCNRFAREHLSHLDGYGSKSFMTKIEFFNTRSDHWIVDCGLSGTNHDLNHHCNPLKNTGCFMGLPWIGCHEHPQSTGTWTGCLIRSPQKRIHKPPCWFVVLTWKTCQTTKQQ